MAHYFEITCISTCDRPTPWERLTHIGGRYSDRTRWRFTHAQAIDGIEAGTWYFYVIVGGRFVWVDVAVSRSGDRYLKTEADGEQPNTLLSLPECPDDGLIS